MKTVLIFLLIVGCFQCDLLAPPGKSAVRRFKKPVRIVIPSKLISETSRPRLLLVKEGGELGFKGNSNGDDVETVDKMILRNPSSLRQTIDRKRSKVNRKTLPKKMVISENAGGISHNTLRETMIEGNCGEIKVNGKILSMDDDFKAGNVRVLISRGTICINSEKIFHMNPNLWGNLSVMEIQANKGVKKFEIKINKDGSVRYEDDKGKIANGKGYRLD